MRTTKNIEGQGKVRSRTNAYKHGLAARQPSDPKCPAMIETLAESILRTAADTMSSNEAYEIARAQVLLNAVARVRARYIAEVKIQKSPNRKIELVRLDDVLKLDRYERRLRSKMDRAIRKNRQNEPN
jgi:hypothetical protein